MTYTFQWLDRPKFSAEQVRGIALGATYLVMDGSSTKTEERCDDLDFQGMRLVNRMGLKGSWGLTGNDDSLEAMAALLDGMHAPGFDTILEAIMPATGGTFEQQQAVIAAAGEQFGPEGADDAANFLAALSLPQMPARFGSTYAWDLGRAAMLARRTVAAKWTKPEEAAPILEEAARRSREAYGSWEEYGVSFVVGRALWAADGEHFTAAQSLDETLPVLAKLLSEPTSPWVRLPW